MVSETMPLVTLNDGRPVVSSLAVAEHFGKEHKNVLRAIETIKENCPPEFHRLNFEPMVYEQEIGSGAKREFPMYFLTRDGFTLLVMGFTGKKALAWKLRYIEAFNAMEGELKRLAHGRGEQLAGRLGLLAAPAPELIMAQRGIRASARVTLVNVALQLAKIEGGGSVEMLEHYASLCRMVTAGVAPGAALAQEVVARELAEETARQVGDWVSARLEIVDRGLVQCKRLYADFIAWCEARGDRPASLRGFGLVMKELFQRVESNVVHYRGVALKEG